MIPLLEASRRSVGEPLSTTKEGNLDTVSTRTPRATGRKI